MATLELCDLCGGKVMNNKATVIINGRVVLYDGKLPDLPQGFKYREDEDGQIGVKFIKVWDSFGNIIRETKFIEKPAKAKDIRVNYDLCEFCLNKLVNLLENLRQHYHLEKKEIEILEYKKQNPFSLLGFSEMEDDDE